MRATRFEFEQRFWIFGAIFWIGFALGAIDHQNVTEWALLHLAPGIHPDSPRELFWLHAIFIFGAAFIFSAALLRTWATAFLKTEIVHDMSQHSEAIVAGGPYRYVRNPLYLANLVMAVGIGFLASRIGWVFIVGGMWLFNYRLILREEDGLIQTQGEPFRRYLRTVPRLLPSITSRAPVSGASPQWGQAFAGESFIWMFGAAMLCFAITMKWLPAAVVFGCAFPVYFIAVGLAKRRAASHQAQAF